MFGVLPETRIVYQPILDLARRQVVGYEALARADGVSPRDLFARAREAGREVEFDLECLRLALAGAAGLGPGQRVFINLRPATVQALVRGEVCLLPPAGIRPVWELPEEDGWPPAGDGFDWGRLRALLARWGEIALDDMGEGFQDLKRLKLLRPDWVKVGRELVSHLDSHDEGRAIVRYLAVLARDLGARIVAEGIETVEEWRCCRGLGVGYGQGFLFAMPGPMREVSG